MASAKPGEYVNMLRRGDVVDRLEKALMGGPLLAEEG